MIPVLLPLLFAAPADAKSRWESTIERVSPSIVSLQLSSTRSFDNERAGNSQGTGFIVDAEKGLILTNRHLVESGPVVAEAIFLNNEEVPIRAIYRDPVHDFGFYQFDPEALEFMEASELSLNPEGARVGVEIRLIGNNEGEKISILSGTLARLDRQAPNYGRGYNDFNTFYIQAASGTSGGSSGSPILNRKGEVVALNAGGSSRGASSFYLPLNRIERALALIQEGLPVTRGTLQWTLEHTPFDELRRLGLQHDTEAAVREQWKDGTGMLRVKDTLPGGPAGAHFQPGDILTHLNGRLVTTFLPLEEVLDESVGEEVSIRVERGGEAIEAVLRVDDLHSLSPSAFVEAGGSVIHDLSYQKARHYGIPVEGLIVSQSGYMLSSAGIPRSALIREVGGTPVASLDELWEVFSSTPDGASLPIRYASIHESWREQLGIVKMDHKWFPFRRCERDDTQRFWSCMDGDSPPNDEVSPPRTASIEAKGPGPVSRVSQSLVMVDYDIPHRAEGVYGSSFRGAGVVVDTAQGLVLTDRDTVPVALGDCQMTFGASVRVPCQVEFIHPLHNFSVISYDPTAIGDTAIQAIRLAESSPNPGDTVWQVGLSSRFQTVWRETRVARVEALNLPRPSPPQFRDINLESIRLDESTPSVGGVLINKDGEVQALWASFRSDSGGESSTFFRGLPVEFLDVVLDPMLQGHPPSYRIFGLELATVSLADAQDMGLSQEDSSAFEKADPERRQILSVSRLIAGSQAAELFEGGDLLLSVNGERVTRFADLEALVQAENLAVEILRSGERRQVELQTLPAGGLGIERVLTWQGALLHAPHFELAAQRALTPEGVYISFYSYGSPASKYGLRATRRIVEVDGQPTLDLDAFLASLESKSSGDSIRIKSLALDNQVHVTTLKLDHHYWPTRDYRLSDGQWTVQPLSSGPDTR
ncbi:MAG: trypsin-like peptidase domain-containing protein [Myxococcota bacterium]|nr:trypsin-like peptidase domain-containing protein [Myxococcota bacterium]